MGLVARRMVVLLGGAAMAVAAGSMQAYAQNAQVEDTVTNEEARQGRVTLLQRIVVGAGQDKVAIDTPQAVTVVEQEDIDRQQAATTGEILREVPGVQVIGSDRVFGEAFNIRGIGATENSADAARVVITVDGAPKFNEQYRMGSFFSDPELYKKVEVLRGPASSTLYGSGAIGGVINLVTKDASDFIAPGDTGAVRLKGTYETNGNGTLASGVWAHRFNDNFEMLAQGNWRRADEMEKANGLPLIGSAFNAYSGLIKGTWYIDHEQVVRASYQRWDSNADDQPYTQTSATDPAFGFGTVDRHVIDQTWALSYENPAADNPWLDLNVALTYSDTQNRQGQSTGAPATPGLPTNTAILLPTDYAYKTLQLKADNTFDYIGDSFENYLTVGLQASRQHRLAGRPSGALALPSHPEGTENKLGLFAQNEFVWDDRLTLIPGARVDFYGMNPDPTVAVHSAAAERVTGTAFSPKLAAHYKINDNFGVFGSVAHTERFPTLDELFSTTYNFTGLVQTRGISPGLKKERSDNYELGFATSFHDIGGGSNSLGFKATGFYNDIRDGIRTNPATGGAAVPNYINVNNMRIYGVELEGAFETDYFFWRLAYTHLIGEYTSDYTIGTTTIAAGDSLETIPQNKLVLTLGARLPEHGLSFGATTTFAAEGQYVVPLTSPMSPTPSTGDPDDSANAWTRVDVFANWKPEEGQFKGWEAQFGVYNLFNANYRENLRLDRSKGRTFKITLARQFGY